MPERNVVGRPFWACYALSALGSGLALPFLGYYLKIVRRQGTAITALELGMLAASALATSLVIGRRIRLERVRPYLLVGSAAQAAGFVSLALLDRRGPLFAAVLLLGFGNGTFNTSFVAYLRGPTDDTRQRGRFATKNLLYNFGLGLGALFGSLLTHSRRPEDYEIAFLLDALTFLALAAGTVLLAKDWPAKARSEPSGTATPSRPTTGLTPLPLALLMTSACMVFGFSQLESGIPLLLLTRVQDGVLLVGLVFSVNAFSVAVLQAPVTRLARRASSQRLLLVLACLWVAAAVCGAAGEPLGARVPFLIALVLLFSAGECLFGLVVPALVIDAGRGDRSSAGYYVAAFTGSGSVGSAYAVVLASALTYEEYMLAFVGGAVIVGILAFGCRTSQ